MVNFRFPERYRHEHPPIRNIYEVFDRKATLGERMADRVATMAGSWQFIIIQSLLLALWVFLNVSAWLRHWDPYPFILMNLLLSLQAAYTAPIIMISQNRMAARDRLASENDYQINLKAEEEIRVIMEYLYAQGAALQAIYQTLKSSEQKQ